MTMARAVRKKARPARVKVGKKVGYSVGGWRLAARVIEDRGDLGARGQQVVRLSVEDAHADSGAFEVEVPVEWLEPAPRA
jgi:hypothetical protein